MTTRRTKHWACASLKTRAVAEFFVLASSFHGLYVGSVRKLTTTITISRSRPQKIENWRSRVREKRLLYCLVKSARLNNSCFTHWPMSWKTLHIIHVVTEVISLGFATTVQPGKRAVKVSDHIITKNNNRIHLPQVPAQSWMSADTVVGSMEKSIRPHPLENGTHSSAPLPDHRSPNWKQRL